MNQDERNEVDSEVDNNGRDAEAVEAKDREGVGEAGDAPGDSGAQAVDGGTGQDEQAGGDADRDPNEEVARMKEAMLRLRAEMDNREKRLEREMSKTRKFALESLMRDLVQVLDSMDQALASADPDDARSLYEGLELTRKQAVQVLTSHGLEVLDPVGEPFDPTWHEAMTTQPSDEHDPDTVMQVLQKGYRLNDRLIRPARVIVAREA